MTINTIFIRKELYSNEFRCPIVPSDVKKLISIGFEVFIESSETRCFTDNQFEKVGGTITNFKWFERNDWIVIGLKELDNIEKLNSHIQIYFSHSYKNQSGSEIILNWFKSSNSILYDLEYFVNSEGKRLVAFGYFAGFVGAGLGLLQYIQKINGTQLSNLKYWLSYHDILNEINQFPLPNNLKVCVIGPNGRCGQGALKLLDMFGIVPVKLTRTDVKSQLEDFDIVINTICLSEPVGAWYDHNTHFYKNTVIVDVSCDYTSPNNPIKIYQNKTTWSQPVFSYNKFVDIIAIDNLPSLLPINSSTEFSSLLTGLLMEFSLDPNKYWAINKAKYELVCKNFNQI